MGGERWLEGEGNSIAAVLRDLADKHPPLALHVFDEAGSLRRNIVFLHDGMVIRAAEAHARQVNPGDEIVLTNALAGG
jgi:hypothetical protein